MKKLIILFFLLSNSLFAQNRFSKLYNSEFGGSDISSQIEVLDNGFLFCSATLLGTQADTFNYAKQILYIVRTDFNGDTIWTKKYYRKGVAIGAYITTKINEDNYLLAGRTIDYVAYRDSNLLRDVFLVKINLDGDTLWTKTISLGPGDELVSNVIKTLDGGYVIYGQACNQAITNCDNFLIKLDSDANLIYTKKYSFNNSSFEQPGGIVELSDSSLYLFGNTELAVDQENAYLIKTDQNGNLIWHKRIGLDGYRRLGVSIHNFKNGLLLNIVKATDLPDSGDALLINIDTSGNIIWQKIYGGIRNDNLRNLFIQNDSIILGIGSSKTLSNNSYTQGWFLKINSNGDTLWQKIYNYQNVNDIIEQNNFFYDIKPSQDGYILLGNAFKKNVTLGSQDVWLLKLDSMGCLYENCITPTGIDALERGIQQLVMSPNPTKNILKFYHPTAINSYVISDYTGKIVLQGLYDEEGVNVELLPAGLYVVQVILENSKQVFGKMMKE